MSHSFMLKLVNNGGLSHSLLCNGGAQFLVFFSSSSSSSSSSESPQSMANFLVNSLGFTNQQALSHSSKLSQIRRSGHQIEVSDFDSISKAVSVISFLKNHGFQQSNVRDIALYDYRILRAGIDKTLKPKLEFLQEQGLSRSDLVRFVTQNPVVLTLKLNSFSLPAIQTLREVMGNEEDASVAFSKMRHTSIRSVAKNLMANVDLLRETYGIEMELIRKKIVWQPNVYVRDTESFKGILVEVEQKWGIPRSSPMFLYGVNLLSSLRKANIDSKCGIFRSFGWSESDIEAIMRRHPNCFLLSESRVRKSLEFFMNELGYKPDVIISRPALLFCSLEKVIIPRHKVLKVLKEKGLINGDYPLYRVVCISDANFVKRFVLPFEEVHEVYTKCTGRPLKQVAQENADIHS